MIHVTTNKIGDISVSIVLYSLVFIQMVTCTNIYNVCPYTGYCTVMYFLVLSTEKIKTNDI
jgi:hypothetical protein